MGELTRVFSTQQVALVQFGIVCPNVCRAGALHLAIYNVGIYYTINAAISVRPSGFTLQ